MNGNTAPLASVIRGLLRHPRLIIGLPLAFGILGVLLVQTRRGHVADVSFTPQSSEGQSGRLSGLASQLGLPISLTGDAESPDFYRALVTSHDLLAAAAQTEFRFALVRGGTDSLFGTYLELNKIKGRTELDRVSRAARRLRRGVTAGVDRQGNLVGVRVRTRWPELSEMMAQRILELVNEFNLQKRQTQARAERQFLEERREQARIALEQAESAQRRFLERNRVYQGDPQLTFQYQALTRQVDQSQAALNLITQSYEQARIEEVRNTPVITVVQNAWGTVRPSSRLSFGAAMGMFVGGILALSIVLVLEYAERERQLAPAAYEDLEALSGKLARRLLPRSTVK